MISQTASLSTVLGLWITLYSVTSFATADLISNKWTLRSMKYPKLKRTHLEKVYSELEYMFLPLFPTQNFKVSKKGLFLLSCGTRGPTVPIKWSCKLICMWLNVFNYECRIIKLLKSYIKKCVNTLWQSSYPFHGISTDLCTYEYGVSHVSCVLKTWQCKD
jgi:hypothetical protein